MKTPIAFVFWLHNTLFFFCENVVFPAQAEYSYFSPILGWKYSCITLFLNYSCVVLHCACAPSLFIAVSEVQMPLQTTLELHETKVPNFVSTMSRTIKCNPCSKLFVNQEGLFYEVKLKT